MKTCLQRSLPALGILPLLLFSAPAEPAVDAFAIEDAYLHLAQAEEWWPGFDPAAVPLAIYDGCDSYLFRHPSPGPEWNNLPRNEGGVEGLYLDGRHPGIVAHTNTDIDGVATATLFFDGAAALPASARTGAAIALHEAFHVFQREHFPDWNPNEALLFTYPVDDLEGLVQCRLESEAWRRAATLTDRDRAGWCRLALAFRKDRFARLAPEYAEYEAKLELLEGLAACVQERAEGRTLSAATLPEEGFPATAVRLRCYRVGAVLAHLLDRQDGAWRRTPPADFPFLHERLERSLPGEWAERRLSQEAMAKIRRQAEADLAALAQDRQERRERFFAEAPSLLHLTTTAEQPLWPRGFDPMNVTRVEGGILHSRMLLLGNEHVSLEMLKTADAPVAALTVGAGSHPLFHGVREVWLRLPHEPVVDAGEETTTVSSAGLALRIAGAFEIARDDRCWTIRPR